MLSRTTDFHEIWQGCVCNVHMEFWGLQNVQNFENRLEFDKVRGADYNVVSFFETVCAMPTHLKTFSHKVSPVSATGCVCLSQVLYWRSVLPARQSYPLRVRLRRTAYVSCPSVFDLDVRRDVVHAARSVTVAGGAVEDLPGHNAPAALPWSRHCRTDEATRPASAAAAASTTISSSSCAGDGWLRQLVTWTERQELPHIANCVINHI